MGDNWATHAKHWAGLDWEVHAVDQRNHGKSPHHGVHNYDAMAADLEAYMDEKGLNTAVILGFGRSATEAAACTFAGPLPRACQIMSTVSSFKNLLPLLQQLHGFRVATCVSIIRTTNLTNSTELLKFHQPFHFVAPTHFLQQIQINAVTITQESLNTKKCIWGAKRFFFEMAQIRTRKPTSDAIFTFSSKH